MVLRGRRRRPGPRALARRGVRDLPAGALLRRALPGHLRRALGPLPGAAGRRDGAPRRPPDRQRRRATTATRAIYFAVVYRRGAAFLDELRERSARRRFWRLLRGFVERSSGRIARGSDFLASAQARGRAGPRAALPALLPAARPVGPRGRLGRSPTGTSSPRRTAVRPAGATGSATTRRRASGASSGGSAGSRRSATRPAGASAGRVHGPGLPEGDPAVAARARAGPSSSTCSTGSARPARTTSCSPSA